MNRPARPSRWSPTSSRYRAGSPLRRQVRRVRRSGGEAAALVSASPGVFGASRSQRHVRALLGQLGAYLLPDQVSISKAHEAFDASGALKDAARQKAAMEVELLDPHPVEPGHPLAGADDRGLCHVDGEQAACPLGQLPRQEADRASEFQRSVVVLSRKRGERALQTSWTAPPSSQVAAMMGSRYFAFGGAALGLHASFTTFS